MTPLTSSELAELERLARECVDVHCVTIIEPDPPERRLALGALSLIEEVRAHRADQQDFGND